MLSAPFTVLAKLVELRTSNIPNSCVDYSTNTWASLLTGRDLTLYIMHVHDSCAMKSHIFFSLLCFRIYINFVDMDAANVGWDSNTFA